MRILDKYWTNYESPETIDRKSRPPVLNFALVKRINGRSGNDPEPFEWKGAFLDVDNPLENPEPLECSFQPTNNEIHCASSTLAAIYHKNAHGIEGMINRCKVNVFGKCVQIFPCERRYQFEDRIVDYSLDEKESFDIGQRFGVAIDTLFTSPGEVTESTNAEIDKLAYFCVFERELEGFKLHIRKEVDIMLRLRSSYMPIELKTRTWLGMNKKAFFYQLIPSLFTRCYLIDCFTIMIAVREEKNASSIIKVLFIEDIRDIAFNQYGSRRNYFRFLLRMLSQHRQAVTEIEYTRTSIHFNCEGKSLTENLDDKQHPPSPYFPLQGDRPDLVICRDPEFDEIEPTLSDLCTLRKWATEERWSLHKAASTIYILAWRFESLLDLLLRHTESNDAFSNKIFVFMLDAEDTPVEDEIAFACHVHLGNNVKIQVELFDDTEELEDRLEELDLYENCSHALVLLGSGQSLPISFAIRNTDIFHICNFPRKEIMDMVTMPEKIAVFGTCQQCVDANEKLSKMDMFEGYDDYTYFFAMDTNIVLNMNFKNLIFVTEQTEILDLLKMYDLPYVV